MFWQNWAMLEDPFVSNILRFGYRLPILRPPPLTSTPRTLDYSECQTDLLAANIAILLEKRAIEVVHHPANHPGFYSPIFLVPKKDSDKMRMIHNMAYFNEFFLEPPAHFRMVSLEQIRSKLQPLDWMISLDLQDAYLHVPIFEGHRKFLRFFFNGTHYQWRVLPFGISSAPWLFTRITQPIVSFLHQRGIDFDPYIDDCFMAAHQRPLLLRQRDFTLSLLQQLGWIINEEKSQLTPARRLVFIGGLFLTDQDLLTVPLDRWNKIQAAVQRGLKQPLKLREWQSILGLLTSAQDLTRRGRLMIRPLQRFIRPFIQRDALNARIHLPVHLHRFLEWWTEESNVFVGVSLSEFVAEREMFVDASLQGWGAHLTDQTVSGLWPVDQQRWHINNLEMEATILAIQHWLPLLHDSNLLIASDSSAVVWTIRNQGTTRSLLLLEQAFRLFHLLDSHNIQVRARHVAGCNNVLADALSRPDKPSPTEWTLHPKAFRLICDSHHRPMVDLFATSFNNQLPIYVSPIPDPAAWGVDALHLSWEGLDAYAFPPPILLPRVVAKIQATQNLLLTLVAPYWPARPWFPALRSLVAAEPSPLPVWPQLLRHPHSRMFHPDPAKFSLAVWIISRRA